MLGQAAASRSNSTVWDATASPSWLQCMQGRASMRTAHGRQVCSCVSRHMLHVVTSVCRLGRENITHMHESTPH